ncbi:hypothetical protein [Clostridium tyrobutyricum]|uniref:hypothetical protein n=1 Tax=Clostridium tyrobutyricum TaxID=1519 RepID=UPI000E8981F9|nr:hypothetical protein [Clostridium tyrobutyricum]HBF77796.1 hypothetical protein [Clostridiaceae bacterium]HBG39078.1 hypothetical protein [Clostridiaceae bacterium]
MDEKYIYTVTVFEDLDESYGLKGRSRCFGYYNNFDLADKTVRTNATDINECTYTYAVIEKVSEGLVPCNKNRWFYKFDYEEREYYPIPEPKELEHYCNFGIG